jgi:hypothetical protein
MNEKTTPGCSQKAEASPVSCCGSAGIGTQYVGPHGTVGSPHWISGSVETAAGFIPKVSTVLCFRDRLGGWKVRWGLGRMRYTVAPGLYAVGEPDAGSPVFVSANYKLSFDRLRESLSGIDGWILVLDTRGVNVWCAAGKGTFGTEEVLRGLEDTALGRLVSHRVLILPQLSAPGVAADEVYRRSGFQIVFGPVRACDLPAFLDAGMAATPEMRRVRFDFRDRIVLAPVELVQVVRHPVFLGFLLLWVLNAAGWRFLSLDALAILGAILVGTVAVPAFLPWIPGRALSWKGWLLGLGCRRLCSGAFLCLAAAGAFRFPGDELHRIHHLYLAFRSREGDEDRYPAHDPVRHCRHRGERGFRFPPTVRKDREHAAHLSQECGHPPVRF